MLKFQFVFTIYKINDVLINIYIPTIPTYTYNCFWRWWIIIYYSIYFIQFRVILRRVCNCKTTLFVLNLCKSLRPKILHMIRFFSLFYKSFLCLLSAHVYKRRFPSSNNENFKMGIGQHFAFQIAVVSSFWMHG